MLKTNHLPTWPLKKRSLVKHLKVRARVITGGVAVFSPCGFGWGMAGKGRLGGSVVGSCLAGEGSLGGQGALSSFFLASPRLDSAEGCPEGPQCG